MMNTTNLFIEILIIGLGGFIAIILFIFAFMPETNQGIMEMINGINSSAWIMIAFLVYFIGILIDRISDRLLIAREEKFRQNYYASLDDPQFSANKDLRDARALIFYKSSTMTNLLEYGRSRLRICRGWILNCFLIADGLLCVLIFRSDMPYGWVLTALLASIFLGGLSYWAWQSMAKAELDKLYFYSKHIRIEKII